MLPDSGHTKASHDADMTNVGCAGLLACAGYLIQGVLKHGFGYVRRILADTEFGLKVSGAEGGGL